MSNTSILLIGATGYIGGSVLQRLLEHPNSSTYEITVLVRSAEKAKLLEESYAVKAAIGSTSDTQLLETLAETSHVVLSTANADDMVAIQSILRGLQKRHVTTGDIPVLIHTSGTGVLATSDKGEFATETIYDDLNAEQIESLPPTAIHRDVDLALVEADQQGYVKTHIILPSLIYGIASGALVDSGIQNKHSIQVPALVGAALARGEAGFVGKGLAMWPAVSIDDISDLYITLHDLIANDHEGKVGHGREGFYFGENGEFTWAELSGAIGEALYELGVIKSQEISTFTEEDLVKCFGSETVGNYFGTNSRCRANRARSIGWEPKHTKSDLFASVKPEISSILSDPEFFRKFRARFAH